mmetsp:Transcript_9082/g.14361  ORF Transcript_9082/g.14361 Transcript_9082/m.14361 type:complete len:458 (+) Transcript_9082:292-1665(+)
MAEAERMESPTLQPLNNSAVQDQHSHGHSHSPPTRNAEYSVLDYLGPSKLPTDLLSCLNLDSMAWMGYPEPTGSKGPKSFDAHTTDIKPSADPGVSKSGGSASLQWTCTSPAEKELMKIEERLRAESQRARTHKREVFSKIKIQVENVNANAKAVVVGSTAAGIDDGSSDLDVTVLMPEHSAQEFLRKLNQIMVSEKAFDREFISSARVPILHLKYLPDEMNLAPATDRSPTVPCDVSHNQVSAVWHALMMKYWCYKYRSAHCCATLRLVKHWLKARQIPSVRSGGIAMVAWMIIAVLCCKEMNDLTTTNTVHPLDCLLEFFKKITTYEFFSKSISLMKDGTDEYEAWLGIDEVDEGDLQSEVAEEGWWSRASVWTRPNPRVEDPYTHSELINPVPLSLWLLVQYEAEQAKAVIQSHDSIRKIFEELTPDHNLVVTCVFASKYWWLNPSSLFSSSGP